MSQLVGSDHLCSALISQLVASAVEEGGRMGNVRQVQGEKLGSRPLFPPLPTLHNVPFL